MTADDREGWTTSICRSRPLIPAPECIWERGLSYGEMSVKVIKQGQKPESRVYRGACRTCHTEIEFERHEAKYNVDQRDGDYLSIRCPTCSSDILVAA